MEIYSKGTAIILALLVVISSISFYWLVLQNESAERPDWEEGYDWWYNSYFENDGFDGQTGKGWEQSYQRYVVDTTKKNDTPAYEIREMEFNGSRLNVRFASQDYWSLGLTVLDDLGIPEGNNFKWPLEESKSWRFLSETYNYSAKVEKMEDVNVPAGTFESFKVVHRYDPIELEDGRLELVNTLFYSDDAKNIVRYESLIKGWDVNGTYIGSHFQRDELVAYGFSDKDGDGLSDMGERFFGTRPDESDSDGDGFKDGFDIVPHLDMSVYIDLVYISVDTNDGCEPLDEGLLGEGDGCDTFLRYGISTSDDTLPEQDTAVIQDSDATSLEVRLEHDVDDDLSYVRFDLEAFDDDSNSGDTDDTLDIWPAIGPGATFYYYLYPDQWYSPWEGRHEPNSELIFSGNGDGDYDADLTLVLAYHDPGSN